MIELIRNCAHGSEVATYIVDAAGGRTFVKVALTPEGREALSSEVAGWGWYQTVRFPSRSELVCRTLRRDVHVMRIEIEAFAGEPGSAANGLRANRALIARAIAQYCALWPQAADGSAPIHGDLSCDNLIRGRDDVVIIDWEHFQASGGPWGFDAVYLLFEAIYFERARQRTIGEEDIRFVAGEVRRLSKTHPLPQAMLDAPLDSVRHFIRGNAHVWRGELERNPSKLPILALSDAEVRGLDEQVRQALDGLS
jgi:hypothetical protein